jgi:hypothetical protein
MKTVTVIYSPQCPSNTHFIREIKEWSRPYNVTFEIINIFEESEKALRYIQRTPIGYTKHLFITTFVDGRWVSGHPGNPQFRRDLLSVLEETR